MDSPIEYIRAQASSFRSLGSKIQQLQHRAALAKVAATAKGNTAMAQDMASTITRLGSLRTLHAGAVSRLDNLNDLIAKIPGAGDAYLGVVPVIPIALVSLATALVAIMVVVYHKYSVESQRLSLGESVIGVGGGTPTPEQIAALDALARLANSGGGNPADKGIGGAVTSLLQPLAIGVALVVVGPKLLEMIARRK